MRYTQGWFKIVIIASALLFSASFCASAQAEIKPTLNNGKKWRIAYCDGGPYTDYKTTFIATLAGLVRLGWLKPFALPKDIGDAEHSG